MAYPGRYRGPAEGETDSEGLFNISCNVLLDSRVSVLFKKISLNVNVSGAALTGIPLAGHLPGVTVSWEMPVPSRGLQGDQLPTLRWEARAHRHAVFTQHGLSLPDPYIVCVPPRREQSDPHTLSLSGASQGSDLTRGFLPSWPDTCSICHCPASVNSAPARLFLTCWTGRVCARLNSTPDVGCVCCSPASFNFLFWNNFKLAEW